MRMIWIDVGLRQTILDRPGEMRVLPAGAPHIVLLGSLAEIITTSFGVPVPNPDKKGSDWWDAGFDFHDRISKEFGMVEEMVLKEF